ncbi:39S ribosomal protein L22, mitochondrial [Neofusicoccum ribis]|uniref:39S ribosomal protein L22, mitochondrial n=1 Tax=Neofusicoccum ribis TaxID=45134 RepID=A0ABR3SR89_9PEZI
MSARIPARRLVQPAVSLPLTPHRTFISDLFNSLRKRDKTVKPSAAAEPPKPKNPLLEQYLRNKPDGPGAAGRPSQIRGGLSSSSIFQDEKPRPRDEPEKRDDGDDGASGPADRDANAMGAALNPDPRGAARWQRKMVIREAQRRGRVSRRVELLRTEREDLVKSPMIKTSVKKLVMLARQIQGKPVDEAILQMRFSKKKAAKEVLKHLEYARDHATVARGMGLGEANETKGEKTEIELKDGTRKVVEDRTGMYVDQAWVGRGISVVLKEEATRIRQSEERQQKRANRKLWTQLPDRPIQQQRQHLLW